MKTFCPNSTLFLHKKTAFCKICLLILLSFLFLPFVACSRKVDYFSYVSELRSNILLAQTNEYSLRIHAVKKESPYQSDGIPKDITTRTEIYFLTPSGDKTCCISFQIDGKDYGGEMSYDNVKAEYYFSCNLDASALKQLACTIEYGEQKIQLNALSVTTQSTLSAKATLEKLVKEENVLFKKLTDKYGFAGEIYMRLIYEDAIYYYVGVIDREQNTYAFLINAENGKILAKRQS